MPCPAAFVPILRTSSATASPTFPQTLGPDCRQVYSLSFTDAPPESSLLSHSPSRCLSSSPFPQAGGLPSPLCGHPRSADLPAHPPLSPAPRPDIAPLPAWQQDKPQAPRSPLLAHSLYIPVPRLSLDLVSSIPRSSAPVPPGFPPPCHLLPCPWSPTPRVALYIRRIWLYIQSTNSDQAACGAGLSTLPFCAWHPGEEGRSQARRAGCVCTASLLFLIFVFSLPPTPPPSVHQLCWSLHSQCLSACLGVRVCVSVSVGSLQFIHLSLCTSVCVCVSLVFLSLCVSVCVCA